MCIRDRHYDTPFFFSSNALKQVGYLTIELKKVYRQQDEQFISLLNQIRENKASEATLQALNQRYIPNFVPPKEGNYIRLTTHNAPAQYINEQQLAALPAQSFSFTADIEGDFPETSYPADFKLTLKPGAQVMFIKNDPQHRFYNGMIGEVIGAVSYTHLAPAGSAITIRRRCSSSFRVRAMRRWSSSL